MTKTLLFTVTSDLSYDQRMIRICGSLARAGYEVTLVGRTLPHSRLLTRQPFKQKRLSCFFRQGKLFYLEYNLRLFFLLLNTRFDAVCAVDLDTILPAYWVCRIKGKPCIYDAHEYFTETPEVVHRPGIQKTWEWVARQTVPKLEYCYTVSPGLAEILANRYGVAFAVIRNVPYASDMIPEPTEPKIILYQGALNEGRGLEYAIQAMEQITGAELWLAGEGDLSEKLRGLVAASGLEKKVKFLGRIQPEKLQELTPKAYLGLNLLENRGLSYYHSLANKAFDYVQAGIPSIQMEFPEYRRLHAQYAIFWLLPKLDTGTVAAAIRQLLSEKTIYQELQVNCLAARKELNWEQEEQRLLAFYGKIRYD